MDVIEKLRKVADELEKEGLTVTADVIRAVAEEAREAASALADKAADLAGLVLELKTRLENAQNGWERALNMVHKLLSEKSGYLEARGPSDGIS